MAPEAPAPSPAPPAPGLRPGRAGLPGPPGLPGVPAEGRLAFDLDSEAEAQALEAALRPELGADVPGSRAALRRRGRALEVEVRAEDAGALRAAVNSYLRWAQLALDMHRLARPPPGPAPPP